MTNIAVTPTHITSAYIHIPFCSHKCEFCDFAAVAGLSHLEDEYTEIICKEITERIALIDQSVSPIKLSTIFFGGGTPGLTAPHNLSKILAALTKVAALEETVEFSIETTPHAITPEKAQAWKDMGINRISIGLESLQDSELKAIGRDHTRAQALEGLALASSLFDNINIDFMYGLPTQTLESWQNTLQELAQLTKDNQSITHVSSYCLELAINSPLLLRFPRASQAYPQDDNMVDFFEALLKTLTDVGFEHYEVSNFARPGFACLHNIVYWSNIPYLAFGVGAHRYVDGVRSANYKSLARYMREYMGDEMLESIDPATRVKEGIMLGLRMRRGIDVSGFEKQYGVNLAKDFARQIDKLKSGGFIEFDGKQLRISDAGVLMSNSILAEFM
jgi:oxygen-independent coproporphyrinogen-3 oxidase